MKTLTLSLKNQWFDMINLTKRQFKICEAVHLGMGYYYMGPKDKREVTATERAEALATIPNLPEGWMKQKHEWDSCIH